MGNGERGMGNGVKELGYITKVAGHKGDLRNVALLAKLAQLRLEVLHRPIELVHRANHLRPRRMRRFYKLLSSEPLFEIDIVETTLCGLCVLCG